MNETNAGLSRDEYGFTILEPLELKVVGALSRHFLVADLHFGEELDAISSELVDVEVAISTSGGNVGASGIDLAALDAAAFVTRLAHDCFLSLRIEEPKVLVPRDTNDPLASVKSHFANFSLEFHRDHWLAKSLRSKLFTSLHLVHIHCGSIYNDLIDSI